MNIDMESNQMQLRPLMCEVCLLKQTDTRTTRRNIACCVFIAYNIILLSVTFATLWSVFDLNERLHRTESIVGNLQLQRARPEGSHVDIFGHAFSEQIPVNNAEYGLKGGIQPDNNVESVRRRWNRSASRRRGKKRCKNCLPVVQIEGSGGFGRKNKSDISNLWVPPAWVSPTDKTISKYFDVTSVSKTGRIKVVKGGLYIVYAQMTLSGVSQRGYHVKKVPDRTTIASCVHYTNDKTKYTFTEAKFLTRSCPTFSVVRLKKNDKVFVEEIDGNSGALYTDISATLGLIRIGN